MKIIDYTSENELGEEMLYVMYEDCEWHSAGYLWDLWLFLSNKRMVKVHYDTFISQSLWRNLVTPEEITIFVESLKDNENTII